MPLGMYRCLIDLQVYPPATVLKLGDTPPSIVVSAAAGCPTVGVVLSGNIAGRSPEEKSCLTEAEIAGIRAWAPVALRDAGADQVIDSFSELPRLIEANWP